MTLPPGVKERDFLNAVERVVRFLVPKHLASFGRTLDGDDLAQFIRLKALEGVARYRPEVGPLANYLWSHCQNRVLNILRDTLGRWNECPCKSCNDFSQGRRDGVVHHDGEFCKKYLGWLNRNKAKCNIRRPIDIDHVADEHEPNTRVVPTIAEDMETQEIIQLLDERLPIDLRGPWLKMREGLLVSKSVRMRVVEAINKILEEAGVELPLPVE